MREPLSVISAAAFFVPAAVAAGQGEWVISASFVAVVIGTALFHYLHTTRSRALDHVSMIANLFALLVLL